MATLAELERRLLRGLDANKQNPAHDAIWLGLYAAYQRGMQEATGTCLRRDRVGAMLDMPQGEAIVARLNWTGAQAQRLPGVR